MRCLLLSGLGPGELGPTHFDSPYLAGSLFGGKPGELGREMLRRAGYDGLRLDRLSFFRSGRRHGLLRPAVAAGPHLTTLTLTSILESGEYDFARLDLTDVWTDRAEVPAGDFDIVLLSTTFIWNEPILARAVAWVRENLPGVGIVAGGQYTNLKYMMALHHYPEIVAVVRGDGEMALPMVLDALAAGKSLESVPNVVWRDGERVRINAVEYVDLEAFPSPIVTGQAAVVPYESMRGCPFDCKFCSFPAASPKWRFKSAEKIRDDWVRYGQENGAETMYAMDSTFTIPPTRFRKLLEILPDAGIPVWDGFSRANTLNSEAVVSGLEAAHCFQLNVGFESMNDETLKNMSKRVSVKQNRMAHDLLSRSEINTYGLFIVGYPGETPEMFQDTQDYLVNEYVGHYTMAQFTVTDENMPMWQDRERFRIEADDPNDPGSPWSHLGMDSVKAGELLTETFDKVRRTNDRAVLRFWQHHYQHWLLPQHDRRTNLAVEKSVELLALAPCDHTDPDEGAHVMRTQLDRLRDLGIEPAEAGQELCSDPM
ncbi:radical SAM protein [Streptomyces morookaense]|uniref:B12-binding domain-containing radical SAM protein n=1 Tax=Streptomyces morookaense TaxID=1970 RepID=UPI0033CDB472